MAGKAVYLRKDEIILIRQMFDDTMKFPDEELEQIREEIKRKMTDAIHALVTK